jgi:hypothetical protein
LALELKIFAFMVENCACNTTNGETRKLTIELTLTILLGEPRRREGISSITSNAGARWFTCMCSSCPSFEKRWGSTWKGKG